MGRRSFASLLSLAAVLTGPLAEAESPPAEESRRQMRVTDGFDVELVAAEPLVRQPVAIEFDDRGRLWVIQYIQYPNPAGLKRVQVDRYSRTKYDRVPEPPPHGPRGADRITILEDTDGDGRMDRDRDFLDGLNLATGIAFGHGGVFVLNVPYLLFYPDRNRDDQPDTDPEVLLTGFGMEDAHSVANSLTWGPDGWLYGCQGSTVTANVRGIEFQQGVWRYHPVSREFELFCEGGGNAWGLDFDAEGRLFYSTNYGGYVLVHGLPGAYFVKSFAKHGALHNPFAYGYFEHASHQNFRGGHVTVGGMVYQGDAFPPAFRGKYIAGDLLGHGVYWHDIQPQGSTVKTAHGGELLVSADTTFAPTDVTMGPDGAIYVADWSDRRTAHPDPDADWDRSNGRIYRIAPKGTPRAARFDFAAKSVEELVALHEHASQWQVRHARQELVRRFSLTKSDELAHSVMARLRPMALQASQPSAALGALWTVQTLGRFDEVLAQDLLTSPHPAVRAWTVRFLGDDKIISEAMAHRLDQLAEQEPALMVRQELACAARRLPAPQALPIINAHINRDEDCDDPRMPLLWWWAVEQHSVTGREEVLRRFVRPTLWKSQLGRDFLLPRLIRRYAAEGTTDGLSAVVRLVEAAPDDASRAALWMPILQGLRESPQPDGGNQTSELAELVRSAWTMKPSDMTLLRLTMTLGHQPAIDQACREALSPHTAVARRVALFEMLPATAEESLMMAILAVVQADEPEAVRVAALKWLARVDDERIAAALIRMHETATGDGLKSKIRDVLLGRKEPARRWLLAVDEGRIPASATPLDQVRRVALFDDSELNTLVLKHWGRLQAGTPEERLAEVRRLNNDLRAATGTVEAGRLVFKKHCANCHQLFGEGTKLGPDLTSANRKDLDFLLISLVDPSSVIRKEFVSLVIHTRDGRVLIGLPVARDEAGITLVNAKNETTVIATSDIEELHDSPVSIMPADLYRQLSPQELRDLFACLQRSE
jgi:putative membrane-bound dehydrogenase-like protein